MSYRRETHERSVFGRARTREKFSSTIFSAELFVVGSGVCNRPRNKNIVIIDNNNNNIVLKIQWIALNSLFRVVVAYRGRRQRPFRRSQFDQMQKDLLHGRRAVTCQHHVSDGHVQLLQRVRDLLFQVSSDGVYDVEQTFDLNGRKHITIRN